MLAYVGMISAAIDITAALYGRGVSRYTTNLVRALLHRRDVRLTLYGSTLRGHKQLSDIAAQLKSGATAKADVVIQAYPPALNNFLWNTLAFPKVRSSLPKVQVFHSWDWIQPPDKDLPLVSTIHDLAMLKFPETAHPKLLAMHRQSWKVLKQRKAQIIAVSRATKRDIIELLAIPAERIHVVHEALPEEVVAIGQSLDEEKVLEITQRLKLTKPYVLAVGTREPRKNLERLIEAWEPLSDEYDLVIAGEQGWDATSTGKKLTQLPGLRLLGRVDDTTLAALYTNTAVFCYPSLYEGFGLPILEAFYFDAPVVTSNTSSMPEIAGNAAELVDPLSVESIRAGITTILQEDESAKQLRRQRMIIRQHMFSWKNAAAQTEKVYEQAIAAANQTTK